MKLFVAMLAASMVFASGCANDATSPTVSIAGNWTLRTLNGQPLPVQIDASTEITGERLTLNTDGSYDDVVEYSDGTSSTEVGYYSVSNNAITFVDQTDNNYQYTGSISGNVLTSFSNGYTSVYQKM